MTPGHYLHSDNPRVPCADRPFRHCLRIQTRFTDSDMLGHINNNTYLSYFDLGKARYFRDALGPLFDFDNITVAIVNINVDFYEQAYFTDELDVWTRVMELGTKSLTLEQRVVSATTGAVKCRAVTVMTSFDPSTARATPLLPEWKTAIAIFEGLEA
ncbi:MAG: acyl-CoA thioesterase [Pseudoflavonifractor sp.]|nr:acyl-CoA thioesterase [Alloprevotella sp.]MCM1116952.1 acyl-CoA thioesterase [Pseudoflavonifractor sp.]